MTGASKLFKERLQGKTFMLQGIPGFVTMTHKGNCATCETYATHVIAAVKSPMVAILSHQIKIAFWTVWPQVMTHIEDDAVDEAHGKLSWYRGQYKEAKRA